MAEQIQQLQALLKRGDWVEAERVREGIWQGWGWPSLDPFVQRWVVVVGVVVADMIEEERERREEDEEAEVVSCGQ